MANHRKIWLWTAVSLVLIGCFLFGGVMAAHHWDFSQLSANYYETNTHIISQHFHSISIDTDTADITFIPTEEASSSVVCYERKNAIHTVAVTDDTLEIKVVDSRKWYEHIGIHFTAPKITLYLPESQYTALSVNESTGDIEIPDAFQFVRADLRLSTGDVRFEASASETVNIKTSTGKILVENISAGALDLCATTGAITVSNVVCAGDVKTNVSTGKTVLNHLSCKNLTADATTGSITLENVVAEEKFTISTDTGDVRFNGADAGEISVKTDTGDVTGNLLTDKVFIAHADTGKVRVPHTTAGGKCEISTDTGDIMITVK